LAQECSLGSSAFRTTRRNQTAPKSGPPIAITLREKGPAMLNLRHILFPVDFSERSHGAAPFVTAMAKRFDANVTLLHVFSTVNYQAGFEAGYCFDFSAIKDESEAELAQLMETEFKGLKAECSVTEAVALFTSSSRALSRQTLSR
jgi:Universal stress protein family